MSRAESEEAEILEQLQSESQLWVCEGDDEAGEGGQDEREERLSTSANDQPEKMRWFDLRHPGLALMLWYIFLGFPVAIGITWLNREFIRWLGYEKIMKNPSGIMISRALFATLSVLIITAWALQLTEEAKETRIKKLKEEAKWWKKACEVLEQEKKEAMMMKQSEAHTPPRQLGSPFRMSGGRESRLVWYEEHNEPRDYYPPTPKDMIKEVLKRRARNN